MNNNFVISLIRTYVPIAAGAVISYLLTLGIDIPADTRTGMVTTLTALTQALYYFIARKLEKKWPQLGVLLGVAAKPKY